MMNEATQWRRELAERIAGYYAELPKVGAVALAGSVARGWADEHSDIELDVYWAEPPTEADRLAPITGAGGNIDIFWAEPPDEPAFKQIFDQTNGQISQLWPFEDDEWSEHYYIEGVSIGISGFLAATIDGYLDDVLVRYEPDDERQMRLAAIQFAIPMYGDLLLKQWQERVKSFPHELVVALINEQLDQDEKWWGVDMYAGRDSYLGLVGLLRHMQIKTLRILLALNHIYLPDPRFKWVNRLIPKMEIAPRNLAFRLREVFELETAESIIAMDKIFYETLELIQHYAPEVDVAFARRWYANRRPVNVR